MRIAISERLRPFSHTPGTYCMLPGTTLRLQIFPILIRVEDISASQPQFVDEIALPLNGPIEGFTIQQDLERGVVSLWGHSPAGYFRYYLSYDPAIPRVIVSETQPKKINAILPLPRLSLGSHKAQDSDLISRRAALEEIFPLWHRLGRLTPAPQMAHGQGALILLDRCSEAIKQGKPEHIYQAFVNLYKVGFHGMLSPTLSDLFYQGFQLPQITDASPLLLISEGARLLESLFLRIEGDQIHLLPSLPPEFHCGRLVDVACGERGVIHFEWTKKAMRRLIFDCKISGSLTFQFPKSVKEYRLRHAKERHGKVVVNGSKVALEGGKQYYLDNFLG